MDLSAIQTELQERGFGDVTSTTRLNYWINLAYQVDICEAEDWPFLVTTTTGTAPLAISDLRTVLSVVDSTQDLKLRPMDPSNITDDVDSDLTTVGTPWLYYVDNLTVRVYPANTTDSLSVRYVKVPTALSAGGDTPVLPARFHYLIVDAAVRRAYRNKDNFEAASMLDGIVEEGLQKMRDAYLTQQHDAPDDYIVQSAEYL